MTPATRASRGTKRRCQNDTCGLPFYDLNRSEIVCPNCSSGFTIPVPQPMSAHQSARYARTFGRPADRMEPTLVAASPDEAVPEVAADEPAEEDGDDAIILEVDQDDEEPLALEVDAEPDKED
jgi:hypothetical protein